jgi:hypothetical protein
MTLEGEERIIAIHAISVVGDSNEFAAAGFDFDTNASCAGIKCVFEKFFNHGGGAIDYFTGSNLVGHLVR